MPKHKNPAHAAAHLALWAGMYVAAAVVFLAQVTGVDGLVPPGVRIGAAAFAFCTAVGVYLVDRVKVRDRWLDPADAQAHPERFAFLARNSVRVRALAFAMLVGGAVLGFRLHPLLALAPLCAGVGVMVYAGRPRRERPRPKDIVVVKNAYVAGGITGFAAIVVVIGSHPRAPMDELVPAVIDHASVLVIGCLLLAIRVFADAVVCDLDDEEADRAHGTATLPTHLGRARAWDIALGLRIAIAIALALTPVFPAPARFAWAGVTVVSSVVLRMMSPPRVRDWVDARFAAEALVVTGFLVVWHGM